MIAILAPIWKTRSIGVAYYKLVSGRNFIKILYKDKTGQLLYPNTYCITKDRAVQYPVQVVGKNIRLHIIPIDDMEIVETKPA